MKLAFTPYALKNFWKKPSTVLYPAVEVKAQPNYRGRITYDAEKCVNCGNCVKVCSPAAITRIYEDVEGGQNITYEFDMTSCTFCGTCQDFCEEGAIKLIEDFHLAATDPADLITRGTRFKKKVGRLTCDTANCVFCGMCARTCPEGAITVDRASKTWSVDHSKCVQCGKCIAKCPKKVLSFQEVEEQLNCDRDQCVYCGLCAKKCPQEAITVDRATKSWEVDRSKCVKCGICVKGCPKKALEIGPAKDEPAAPAPAPAETPVTAPTEAAAAPAAEQVNCDKDNCVFCGLCAKKCPQEAITVDRANKAWSIDRDKCVQCGVCVDGCPKKALSLGPAE